MEEMEKRSRRRTGDLVIQTASQGLSQNEIACARISKMARSTNAPCLVVKRASEGLVVERKGSENG
jgi:hypothetical protein